MSEPNNQPVPGGSAAYVAYAALIVAITVVLWLVATAGGI